MKIEKRENKLIVFLNTKTSEKFNFKNKIELEKEFQKLFSKLNKIYDLEICGNYNIEIYNIKQYGIILEIEKQNEEYFSYCDYIDMNLNISKYNDILYKIKNYDKEILYNSIMYINKGEIYIIPRNSEFQTIGKTVENCEIIYGKEAYKIKKISKKIYPNILNVEKIA